MSVITAKKDYSEIHGMLFQRGDLHVVVLGCNKCAKLNCTGGEKEVREMKQALSDSNFMLLSADGMVDAAEEGLCDPESVSKILGPLEEYRDRIQILLLACGAGLKCVHDLLPEVPIVPGLNTLGPGVKDQLACISCGDCRFGQKGCRMVQVVQTQAERLG